MRESSAPATVLEVAPIAPAGAHPEIPALCAAGERPVQPRSDTAEARFPLADERTHHVELLPPPEQVEPLARAAKARRG